jgi:hypothetical protein
VLAGTRLSVVLLRGLAICSLLLLAGLADAARASSPPSAEQVERRTERFLERLGPQAVSPQALRGSGGLGSAEQGGEGSPGPAAPFPRRRMVSIYGAPQLNATALGKRKPRAAGRKVVKQARPYARRGDRRVIRSFDLIGTIATASRGADGKYRSRQPDVVIASYLREIRRRNGRLVIDIQPGRSSVLAEMKALRKWIREPDVDVGIDPEWNVGRSGIPGRPEGSIKARELNSAAAWLDRLIVRRDLPPKAMIVHQFHERSVRGRERLRHGERVAMTLNFDGIGSPAAKQAGYRSLARKGIFNGFSLFYARDSKLMGPQAVLRLRPAADYVMYQ